MTTETPVASQLLSVSILAGPSARALLGDIVASDPQSRFGLLTGANIDSNPAFSSQVANSKLLIEQLSPSSGGHCSEQITQQISTFAAKASVHHLLIECDSQTHPIAFASLFLPDDGRSNHLTQVAQLNSIVLAMEPESLINSIVHGNRVSGVASPCILADQIECADSIVLCGEPADETFILARAIASALNPRASLIERSRAAPSFKLLDNASSFDFEAAFAGAGWRKLMDEEPGPRHGEEGVTAFMYRARRPFYPEKFWNLLQSPFPGVFRAKGFFWLATRMQFVGGLNIADSECHYSPAGTWWAAAARDHHSEPLVVPDRLKKEWTEPFGDRRQAIAFMGIDVDPSGLAAQLDACLLDDSEMTSGEDAWAVLPDPFPAWSPKVHNHECEDHDCCHH